MTIVLVKLRGSSFSGWWCSRNQVGTGRNDEHRQPGFERPVSHEQFPRGILASGNSVLGLNLHTDLPQESGRQDTASTYDNRVITNLNVATLGR